MTTGADKNSDKDKQSTRKSEPKGTSQTRKEIELEEIVITIPQWYFAVGTGELIYIEKRADVLELKKNCNYFNKLVREVRESNQSVSKSIDTYLKSVGRNMDDPRNKEQALADIQKAETEAAIKSAALSKELEGISTGSKKQMVELFPISTGGTNRMHGYKSTFVRSDKIKNHWRRYKLNDEPDLGEMKSFITKDRNGNRIIDTNKLKQSLSPSNLETRLKGHWDVFEPVDGVLTDWAEKWNNELKASGGAKNKYVNCNAQAQLLRYTAGLGAIAEWNPKDGILGAKFEGKAAFAVAQGSADAALFIPHKMGVRLGFTGVGDKVYEMGRIRLQLKFELSGFVGASVLVEAGIEVRTQGNKQYVRGRPKQGSGFANGQMKPVLVKKDAGAELGGEAGAFAGASATAQLAGSMEWLNPENNDQGVAGFKAFAVIAPTIEGQAGAGAMASFHCSYNGGKIRVKAMLGACLGLGAKGKLMLEVDVKTIAEFVVLVYYQVAKAGVDAITWIFDEAVLEFIRKLEAFVLATGEALTHVYKQLETKIKHFEEQYKKYANRKNMATRLISRPDSLKTTLPRAKGHLIWLLTRHDAQADIPAALWGEWELRGTGYNRCVDAINVILTSIQSQKEWIEVFAGIRSDKDKNTGGHNPHRKALNEFYEKYAGRSSSEIDKIKNRLPENMGWKTVWNDNPAAVQESQVLLAKYEGRFGTLPETLICFDESRGNGSMIA